MTRQTISFMSAFMLSSLTCAGALATDRLVPSQYDTIQAAIDAAANGDTVTVADGVYTGPGNRDIRFFGKAITVRSANGPQECIIDPQGLARGFYLIDEQTNDAVIDGFTIRHGAAPASSGGGIFCHRGATIRNCVISESSAYYGGGVWFDNSDVTPVVEYCTIVSNVATREGGGSCGGGAAIIRDCVVANNTAIGAGYGYGRGGGARAGKFERCTITGNTALWGGGVAQAISMVNCVLAANHATYGGGGVAEIAGGPQLCNCLIANNESDWYGGGLYAEGGGFEVWDCTVAENSAGWYGGGVYGYLGQFTIANSIIAHNSAPAGSEVSLEAQSRLLSDYSDILGDPGWLWVSGASFVVWGDGNIDLDPGFVDHLGDDYHLQLGSPCVDTGSNEMLALDWADLDGDGDVYEQVPYDLDDHPRVARFVVDMGAYEVPFGDVNCDGSIGFGDINPFVLLLTDAMAWQAAYPECELLYGDINADGLVGFADINPFVALLTGQ